MDREEVSVASAAEIRAFLKESDLFTEIEFTLEPDAPLANSTEIWDLLFLEGGGFGTFLNPDVLCAKSSALKFVNGKLNQLRRLKNHADTTVAAIEAGIAEVEISMENGGPGVPRGFEAQLYTGPRPFVDVDKNVSDQDQHFRALYAAVMQNTPRSPTTEDAENTVATCHSRAEDEEWDAACLNVDYLKLKRDIMATVSKMITEGIPVLEKKYIYSSSNLGASRADFCRFKEVKLFREDSTDD